MERCASSTLYVVHFFTGAVAVVGGTAFASTTMSNPPRALAMQHHGLEFSCTCHSLWQVSVIPTNFPESLGQYDTMPSTD